MLCKNQYEWKKQQGEALRYTMKWIVGLTLIKSLDGMDSELLENHVIQNNFEGSEACASGPLNTWFQSRHYLYQLREMTTAEKNHSSCMLVKQASDFISWLIEPAASENTFFLEDGRCWLFTRKLCLQFHFSTFGDRGWAVIVVTPHIT